MAAIEYFSRCRLRGVEQSVGVWRRWIHRAERNLRTPQGRDRDTGGTRQEADRRVQEAQEDQNLKTPCLETETGSIQEEERMRRYQYKDYAP
jgi:hypothetical protein